MAGRGKPNRGFSTTAESGEGGDGGLTTFHVIHIVVGAWLILAPLLDVFTTRNALLTNNIVIGAVVALYNAWFLLARANVDTRGRG